MPAQFSANAWEVLRHRYLRKNAQGEIGESLEEMFRRVAHTVAAVEANYHEDVAQWEGTFFHSCSYIDQSIKRENMITLKLDEQEQQASVELLERLLTTMKTTTTMSPVFPVRRDDESDEANNSAEGSCVG